MLPQGGFPSTPQTRRERPGRRPQTFSVGGARGPTCLKRLRGIRIKWRIRMTKARWVLRRGWGEARGGQVSLLPLVAFSLQQL